MEDTAEKVMENLINSIKNLRKNVVVETGNKKHIYVATSIKRTSFLAELEFKSCIALNCPSYSVHEGSPFYNIILDYIELFYDKSDVISDLKLYFKLLGPDDAYALKDKIKLKMETIE
jgi:hypothetical protein